MFERSRAIRVVINDGLGLTGYLIANLEKYRESVEIQRRIDTGEI